MNNSETVGAQKSSNPNTQILCHCILHSSPEKIPFQFVVSRAYNGNQGWQLNLLNQNSNFALKIAMYFPSEISEKNQASIFFEKQKC